MRILEIEMQLIPAKVARGFTTPKSVSAKHSRRVRWWAANVAQNRRAFLLISVLSESDQRIELFRRESPSVLLIAPGLLFRCAAPGLVHVVRR